MQKILLKTLILYGLWQSAVLAGGIPVIDVSSLTQQILQVQHMVQQIEQLQQHIQISQKEFENMSGVRHMGGVINSAYDKNIAVQPQTILQQQGLKNAQQLGLKGTVANLHNQQNQHRATWLAQSQKSLQQSQERFDALSGLLTKINQSPDQKDVLDLQARIQTEQAFLQNETIKLNMLQSQLQAEQALQQQKIQQMRLESTGSLSNFSLLE